MELWKLVCVIGIFFSVGIGNAEESLRKACDGGEMSGCTNLGVLEKEAGNIAEAQSLEKLKKSIARQGTQGLV